MSADFPFRVLEAPDALASCHGWSEEVYRDLLAFQLGKVSQEELDAKYLRRQAILALDLTGFTSRAMTLGARAFLRILDAQKICIPAFQDHGALLIRAFADDLVGFSMSPHARWMLRFRCTRASPHSIARVSRAASPRSAASASVMETSMRSARISPWATR